MHIRKAVITAAGPNQERLPLQRFVDLDGTEKTVLRIILEEVIAAGIEEICLVVRRGSQEEYREAAGDYARSLTFAEQVEPRGYGDALHRAAKFVGSEPFLHLVGDHLYISRQSKRCARAIGRTGASRTVLGLGCATDSREHAPVLWHGGRLARARQARPLSGRAVAGEADADESGT